MENGNLKMFDTFRKFMPSNQEIVKTVCTNMLNPQSPESIKKNFSEIFSLLNDKIYDEYLKLQRETWETSIVPKFHNKFNNIDQLDKFFKSLQQSRVSRAGTVFELTIEELFKDHLNYPMDTQVKIDGGRLDFLLPSKRFYNIEPLNSILVSAKRTLRERWKQVRTEIPQNHRIYLITIDTKLTINQISQMEEKNIFIVTTEEIKSSSPNHYTILSFEEFFADYLDPKLESWIRNNA